jgi:hypothetical protein
MLTENEIIKHTCVFLQNNGYRIISQCNTDEKGIDIAAFHSEKGVCCIEAKGQTSSKKDSARFGKKFDSTQINTHIAVAILKSFKTKQNPGVTNVAISLPDDEGHRRVLDSIDLSLKKSGIKVFLVSGDGSVLVYKKGE